jgi:hypothetical protein
MKNIICITIVVIASAAVHAEDVKFEDLCKHAEKHMVVIDTVDGRRFRGTCAIQRASLFVVKPVISLVGFPPTAPDVVEIPRAQIAAVREERFRQPCTTAGAAVNGILFQVFGIGLIATPRFYEAPAFIGAGIGMVGGGVPVCGALHLLRVLAGTRKLTII